jgi:hypothetical protein
LNEPADDSATTRQAALQTILPRLLGRLVLTANGVEHARQRPDLGVHPRLQRDHLANRGHARRRIIDFLNGRRQPSAIVGVAHERQEKSGPIGKVQIERLTGYVRRLSDVSQPDIGATMPDDEIECGVEDAPPGRWIPATRST